MSYIKKLNDHQHSNIRVIIETMIREGITNPFSQAAILSIISKESSFNCQFERGYGNTSNERIRNIFGHGVYHLSESELSEIKKDDKRFFDLVYGGRYGNAKDEGYKYRGGGFNQITFKGNYESAARRSGHDLVNHPELITQPQVAADAAISYFTTSFQMGFSLRHKRHYNSTGINGFVDIDNAVLAFYHANAGFKKPMYTMQKLRESTGGLRKAVTRAPEFYDLITSPFKNVTDGNKFRTWINDKYPEYARKIDLDRSGSYNNSYIRRAWMDYGSVYSKSVL